MASPSQVTEYQTGFAPQIAPYAEKLLGDAQSLTDTATNPYMQYQGERNAQFSPLQRQSYDNAALMRSSPQLQDATAMAGLAGLGALNTQYTYDPYKSGSITEYFICYKNSSIKKPKTEIQIFKVGSEGDMVKKIQKSLGFEDKNCDGKFGLKTEQKVKEFQKKNEMNPDGIVGPQTLKKLNII